MRKIAHWISPLVGIIAIGCSLAGGLIYHSERTVAGDEHRRSLVAWEESAKDGKQLEAEAVPQYSDPEPGMFARSLTYMGIALFVAFTGFMLSCREARSPLAVLIWVAWLIPMTFAGISD